MTRVSSQQRCHGRLLSIHHGHHGITCTWRLFRTLFRTHTTPDFTVCRTQICALRLLVNRQFHEVPWGYALDEGIGAVGHTGEGTGGAAHAARSMQHTACSTEHAAHSTQHAAHSMQHVAHSTARAHRLIESVFSLIEASRTLIGTVRVAGSILF